MSFARELAEAVEAPSVRDQVDFLGSLDEHLVTAAYTGIFTEEAMEAAMAAILREAGATEDDLEEVYGAIDEWVDEEIDLVEREALKLTPAAVPKPSAVPTPSGTQEPKKGSKPKPSAKPKKKSIGQMIADPFARRVKGIQTKTKTGKMLKHAAAGAIKQIGKKPGSAKEILKKSVKKAGKKLLHHAIKKGLKMVFGRWAKVEHTEAISEATGGSAVLTEAVAVQAWVPIFEQAMGVKIDPRQGKLLVNEFFAKFREMGEMGDWDLGDGSPDVLSDKEVEVEGEGEYIPPNRRYVSATAVDPPEYWAEPYTWSGKFRFPSKASFDVDFNLNIPRVVDGMSPLIKRLFGGEAFMNCRRNLARALLGNDKLFRRFVVEEVTTAFKADHRSFIDVFIDVFGEHVDANIEGYITNQKMPSYSLTLDRLVLGRVMKPVAGSGGPGSDIMVKVESVWSVRMTDEGEWEHDIERERRDSY